MCKAVYIYQDKPPRGRWRVYLRGVTEPGWPGRPIELARFYNKQDAKAFADAVSQPFAELEAQVARMEIALRNVRQLALRMKGDPNALHLLRFCEEAGLQAQVLRETS